ncbi:hypothetical protein AF332_27110 [Sporosarcina globispora]|uniref:Uncharacterized protein n=1 Tax=Sporosarcina globispora TaxID=1459 RepID=A0A0M0GJT1_SPOGL|nr:hypothetical protein [Sporosarcina globispora]KON90109.1 hypothetical protein AF332_27110 [Sporosarcina globispora]
MSKLFTYFPLICFFIILLALEESVMKWALLVIMAVGILIAKYFRKKCKVKKSSTMIVLMQTLQNGLFE